MELAFYSQSTVEVARGLLGSYLVHDSHEGMVSGMIVETEAYLTGDAANHAYKGPTTRTSSMFGPAGVAYIYLIYGMYYCLNVTTARKGLGEAVLIRALEPKEGIEQMCTRRNLANIQKLCSGPGKLTQAMGIDLTLNGHNLSIPPLYIKEGVYIDPSRIIVSERIGISHPSARALPLRFSIGDSLFLSRGVKRTNSR